MTEISLRDRRGDINKAELRKPMMSIKFDMPVGYLAVGGASILPTVFHGRSSAS